MWDYDHTNLPPALSEYFNETNLIHKYNTPMSTQGKLSLNSFNTEMYGNKSFRVQGSKVLNELKDKDFYRNANSKAEFIKKIKCYIFNN